MGYEVRGLLLATTLLEHHADVRNFEGSAFDRVRIRASFSPKTIEAQCVNKNISSGIVNRSQLKEISLFVHSKVCISFVFPDKKAEQVARGRRPKAAHGSSLGSPRTQKRKKKKE